MSRKNTLVSTAFASLAAMAISGPANAVPDQPKSWEKCAGIVAAGKNDCGTSKHSCASQAAVDKDPEEWVYVPAGTCEKIAGGTVKATKPAK